MSSPAGEGAVRRLRRLIALTALAIVVVEALNLQYSDELGLDLAIRTGWALLRAIGFLFLMRGVRLGRMGSRPFGFILAVTTVFAVARLVVPRSGGLLPPVGVLIGFLVLTGLCVAVVYQLYSSEPIAAHLTRRPPKRPVPPWALTTRIAALAYAPLMFVPCLVAAASLTGEHRIPAAYALPLVVFWFVFALAIGYVIAFVSLFAAYGKGWARQLVVAFSLIVVVVQPVLCLLLLDLDGFIRDGIPLIICVMLALYGLWRTRDTPTVAQIAS